MLPQRRRLSGDALNVGPDALVPVHHWCILHLYPVSFSPLIWCRVWVESRPNRLHSCGQAFDRCAKPYLDVFYPWPSRVSCGGKAFRRFDRTPNIGDWRGPPLCTTSTVMSKPGVSPKLNDAPAEFGRTGGATIGLFRHCAGCWHAAAVAAWPASRPEIPPFRHQA